MHRINYIFKSIVCLSLFASAVYAQPMRDDLAVSMGGPTGASKLVDEFVQRLQTSSLFEHERDLGALKDPMASFSIKTMATAMVLTVLKHPGSFNSKAMKPMFELSPAQSNEATRLIDESIEACGYTPTLKSRIRQRILEAKSHLVLVAD